MAAPPPPTWATRAASGLDTESLRRPGFLLLNVPGPLVCFPSCQKPPPASRRGALRSRDGACGSSRRSCQARAAAAGASSGGSFQARSVERSVMHGARLLCASRMEGPGCPGATRGVTEKGAVCGGTNGGVPMGTWWGAGETPPQENQARALACALRPLSLAPWHSVVLVGFLVLGFPRARFPGWAPHPRPASPLGLTVHPGGPC